MRILFVSESFYPHLGGATVVLWKLANSLVDKGYSVVVITSKIENTPQYEVNNGIEIYRPFYSFNNKKQSTNSINIIKRVFFGIKLYAYLKEFLKEQKIDIIYNLAYVPTIPTTILASRKNIPVVTHVGQLSGKMWFQMVNPFIAVLNYIMEFVVLRLGQHNAIRCASHQVAKRIKSFTEAKVFAIPSPVDHNEIMRIKRNTDIEKTREKLGVENDEQFLLYVGSLLPVKNLDGLVKTLSHSKREFKLFIVGDGPEKTKIRRIIENSNLRERIALLGQKPHNEVLRLIRSCDFLVLPSKSEIFPTVVIEALSLGKPVIATEVGGVSEIESPNLFLVKNLDEINQLLETHVTQKDDGENILKEYSLINVVTEFECLFKTLKEEKEYLNN